MRGRLIFPFTIELAQLDIAGTAADPDAGGPRTSGYDSDFREAVVLPTSDRLGNGARVESLVRLPGQFYNTDAFLRMQMMATGNTATTRFIILFHFLDLEALSMVEVSTGLATIKVGDRLNAVYNIRDGTLIQQVRAVPGAYVTEASPLMGLGSDRNLLAVTFESRDQGQP